MSPSMGAACAVVLAGSCGTDPGELLSVELRDASGAHPTASHALLTGGGPPASFSCPGGLPGVARCTPSGFDLEPSNAGRELTVEARGYAFRDVALPESASTGSFRVELQALAPFVADADYRTGFDLDGGEDAFAALAAQNATDLGVASIVKFYISLGGEPRVYFANTRRFPRHFEFARDVLGLPESAASFAANTYQGAARRALAGTLTWLPDTRFAHRQLGTDATAPLLLEFFPSDDLSLDQLRLAYRLVAERVSFAALSGGDRRLIYVPAGSSAEQRLDAAPEQLSSRNMLFAKQVELYAGVGQQVLNPGVAFGTLRRLTPSELPLASVSLRDVLLLSHLPNDIPLVGGTITEGLQTPLSHVNLAARARGTPNLALRGAALDARIAPLIGRLVRFEVNAGGFELREASPEEAQSGWDARRPELLVPAHDETLRGLPALDELTFDDAARIGSKGANLAALRRLLGDEAPAGFVVPFSAYDDYMANQRVRPELCARATSECGAAPAELCAAAEQRCQTSAARGDTFYAMVDALLADAALATDTPLRQASVRMLHSVLRAGELEPSFADELDARVRGSLGTGQVRLRSSTNIEDLPGFSGAGLYLSVSAGGTGARRASARIAEVWASAWNVRAFEERLAWNVDQRGVRMGVVVTPAVDDEAVNGVLVTSDLARPGAAGSYVNVQRGEVEVTNPLSGALPEVFSIVPAPDGGVQVARQRFSSLSPDQPLMSDAEVRHLDATAQRIQLRFAELCQVPPSALVLDLEFKLIGRARSLQVKQARPYAAQ